MAKAVYGHFRHTLDDKNRVRIPTAIRNASSSNLFMVPGRTGALYLVAEEELPNFVSKFTTELDPFSDDEMNDVATAFLSAVEELKEDAQGRVLLRDSVKKIAGIEKEIVFVNKGLYTEVWPAEEYDRRFGILSPTKISEMLAKLKNRGDN